MAIPRDRGDINTPSDGYRTLAADILLPVIEAINAGQQFERNLAVLLSERSRKWLWLLGLDPDVVVERVLKRNGLGGPE